MKSLVPLLLIGLASASSVHAQCNYLAAKTRTCSDGKNFAESFIPDPLNPGSMTTVVCNLDKYDPSNFTATKAAGYQPPRCKGAAADVNPAYLKLIESAYDIAPPAVKRNLCKLTHVFVITADSYPVSTPLEALGRWESYDLGVNGMNMYMAIPYDMLDAASGPASLAAEENALLFKLLNVSPPRKSLPSFTDGPPSNASKAAILAVLAHELGHIILADTNADEPNPVSPVRPCPRPKQGCFNGDFLGSAGEHRGWNQNKFSPRRWITFGDGHGNAHQSSIRKFEDLRVEAGNPKNDGGTSADIQGIYNKDFVSVFAAVSPEEDFVETFKYAALADAPLTNLAITFGGSPMPVLGRTSAELDRKKQCVAKIVP